MLAPRLAVAIALAAATGLCCLGVALLVEKRAEEGAQRGALRAFALWWGALGAHTLVGAARDLAAGLGLLSEPMLVASLHVALVPLAAGLWGLVYYVGFMFLGHRRVFVPSLALYAAAFAGQTYALAALRPAGALPRTWGVEAAYAGALPPVLALALPALLLAPALAALAAYATLFLRVRRLDQKARVALVSLAFLLWAAGLSPLGAAQGPAWVALLLRAGWLASVLLVLVAHRHSTADRGGRSAREMEHALAAKLQEGHDG